MEHDGVGHRGSRHRNPNDNVAYDDPDGTVCVQVKGCTVVLGGHAVLRGLDMVVPQGCVYALLGPSGCGKTTLMRTLVGLYEADEGSVRILGRRPRSHQELVGKVAYVPQSLGLHLNLTVDEQLELYARIAGVPTHNVAARLQRFNTRLRLPRGGNSLIKDLSFGQQKLVSVCAALVTSPRLAVMDEPTVGLDPYRREALWILFADLAAEGGTVFVTTHHVNEAVRANHVAMMRGGVLATQGSPPRLLQALSVETMEDAYAAVHSRPKADIPRLDAEDDAGGGRAKPADAALYNTDSVVAGKGRVEVDSESNVTGVPGERNTGVSAQARRLVAQPKSTALRRAVAVGQIFTHSVFRSKWLNVVAFAFVSLQFILVGFSVGPKPHHLGVTIANEDVSSSLTAHPSATTPDVHDATPTVSIMPHSAQPTPATATAGELMVRKMIDAPSNDIIWTVSHVTTMCVVENASPGGAGRGGGEHGDGGGCDDGGGATALVERLIRGVQQRHLQAVVHLPANFTAGVTAACVSRDGKFPFSVYLNGLDANVASVVQHHVYTAWVETLFQMDLDRCARLEDPTWHVHSIKAPTETITNYVLPSFFASITAMSGMISLGMVLMQEKSNEALDRLQAMGVGSWMITLAPVLAYLPVFATEFFIRFSMMLMVMEGPYTGNLPALFIVNLCCALMGHSFGIACCMVCSSSRELTLLIYASYWWLQVFSGALWPVASLPRVAYKIAMLNPLQWLTRVFRNEFNSGRTLASDIKYTGITVSVLTIFSACFAVARLSSHTPIAARLRFAWRARHRKAIAWAERHSGPTGPQWRANRAGRGVKEGDGHDLDHF